MNVPQTYTPVRGMIVCTSGGDFVRTSDYLTLQGELAKAGGKISRYEEALRQIIDAENDEGDGSWPVDIAKAALDSSVESRGGILLPFGVWRKMRAELDETRAKYIRAAEIAVQCYPYTLPSIPGDSPTDLDFEISLLQSDVDTAREKGGAS